MEIAGQDHGLRSIALPRKIVLVVPGPQRTGNRRARGVFTPAMQVVETLAGRGAGRPGDRRRTVTPAAGPIM